MEFYHIDGDSFAVKRPELFESLRKPMPYRENQLIYQQGTQPTMSSI